MKTLIISLVLAVSAAGQQLNQVDGSRLQTTSSSLTYSQQGLPLRAAIATGAGTFVEMGDSTCVGTASPTKYGWCQQLAQSLKSAGGGDNGVGLQPIYTDVANGWTPTGTWTALPGYGTSQATPVAINSVYCATGTGNTQAFAFTGAYVNIFYLNGPGTGTWSESIDGGSSSTYGSSAGSYTWASTGALSAGSYASHTVTIVAPSSGNACIYGAAPTSGTAGFSVWNVSHASFRSEAYEDYNHVGWLSLVPNLAGGLYAIKANDLIQNIPLATFASNVSYPLSQLRTLTVTGFAIGEEANQTTCNTIPACDSDYDSLLNAAAVANGIPWVSFIARWGTWAQANAQGFMSDSIHPLQNGHNDLGTLMTSIVIDTNLVAKGAQSPLNLNQGYSSNAGLTLGGSFNPKFSMVNSANTAQDLFELVNTVSGYAAVGTSGSYGYGIYTANTRRFFFDQNGYGTVTQGTLSGSPLMTFTGATNPKVTVNNSGTPAQGIDILVNTSNSKNFIGTSGAYEFDLMSNNTGRVKLDSSGNVTILGPSFASTDLRTGTSANTDLHGHLALVSGTQTYTFTGTHATAPDVLSKDQTTPTNANNCTATTTVITCTGTGTDVITYVVIGYN